MMLPKVLWLGDNPAAATSYARVTHEILSGLQRKGYEVCCLGRGYYGWPYDTTKYRYQVLPSIHEFYGSKVLGDAVELVRPDCLIAIGDAWMIKWIKDVPFKQRVFKIAYIPVDGSPLPQSTRQDYRQFDQLVSTSKFGAKQIRALVPESNVQMIYHGVNTSIFRPLDNRELLKHRYGLQGKYVIGCVARNQLRKQFPSLLQAFAKFHNKYPASALFLHTCREASGWALDDFISHFHLEGAVVYGRTPDVDHGFCDEKLNEIYNVFDVMALPTAGEGFGLPLLESMAAGIPVIATDCSACSELLKDRGLLVKVKDFIYLSGQVTANVLPDADDLYLKMCQTYLDERLRIQMGALGRSFAETCTWDDAVDKWDVLLRDLQKHGFGRSRY